MPEPEAARTEPVRPARLTIACNLNPVQHARLAEHWSRPRVVAYAERRPAWDVPPDSDLLFTFFAGWREAPARPPAGWPFGLRWIQVAAAGVDAFPPWFFDGPVITCGRGIAGVPIAEFVLAAILAHEKGFFDGTRIRDAADWTWKQLGLVEGKTLGLLGMGAIATEVAARARAFGMRLAGVRRNRTSGQESDIEMFASAAQLVAASDHLLVALPLTPETRHIVDAATLAQARPGLHLVNVSRGELIDQEALIEALDAGRVGAATLDVTTPEPLPAGHPLYTHPRVRLSPHISWTAADYDDRLARKLHANLDNFLHGRPLLDIVPRGRGY